MIHLANTYPVASTCRISAAPAATQPLRFDAAGWSSQSVFSNHQAASRTRVEAATLPSSINIVQNETCRTIQVLQNALLRCGPNQRHHAALGKTAPDVAPNFNLFIVPSRALVRVRESLLLQISDTLSHSP